MPLGTAQLEIRVKGCAEDLHAGGYLAESENWVQNGYEKVYNNVPAQFLEVKIDHISDESVPIGQFSQYFNGDDPIVRSINLISTEEEDKQTNKVLQNNEDDSANAGTPGRNIEDLDSVKSAEKLKETVRFQYDGVLKMDFSVASSDDSLACIPVRDPAIHPTLESFHVVEYMDIISIDIQLKFEIYKEKNLYCNLVDTEKHKLSIESNLGMDRNAGFKEFFDKLPSEKERELISICSSIAAPGRKANGACLFEIDSSKTFSGKKDLKLVAGRPNINTPYTKNVNVRVVGADNNVQHTAFFFIEGLFSKGG